MPIPATFAIPFIAPDPVAFEIVGWPVRWYGLAYMAGLLLGWLYIRQLVARSALWGGPAPIDSEAADNLLLWATLGVVVGGRLGFVLFYEPAYYLANPEQILALWRGGMSFHGGLIGTGLALFIFARRNGAPFLSLADIATAAVPIGLFFGRLANFINAELVGRVSDVPWAMVFPGAGPLPRHPSQLYEAALEGLLLFFVIRYFTHVRHALRRPGFTSGIFLMGGLARSFAELFRAPDPDHLFTLGPWLTPGIAYSLPMIAFGAYLVWRSRAQDERSESAPTIADR